LLRLFIEQAITALASRQPGNDEPYKVLLILDEMHTLGDMPSMTTIFSLLAGYNCRIMAVVQSISVLDKVYGRDKRNTILANCAHQVFFASNELSTPEYVSKSCGNKIVETVSVSRKQSFKYEAASKNTGQAVRPLLSEADMKLMSGNEQIILVEKCRPVRTKKIVYYKDKQLKARLLEAPEVPVLEIEEQKIPKFNRAKRNKPEPDDMSDSSAPMPHNPPNNNPSLDGMLDLMPEESSGPIVAEGFVNSILNALQDED
jgi:type IV secretion system protein VirD4